MSIFRLITPGPNDVFLTATPLFEQRLREIEEQRQAGYFEVCDWFIDELNNMKRKYDKIEIMTILINSGLNYLVIEKIISHIPKSMKIYEVKFEKWTINHTCEEVDENEYYEEIEPILPGAKIKNITYPEEDYACPVAA